MNDSLKISIITIAYNNASDIEPTLRSVSEQTYENIEYIVVDGASTDGTLDIIDRYRDSIDVLISEPDDGMYDAINKGIKRSTGDVVGLIHAGDRLHDKDVVGKIAAHFVNNDIDAMYGYSRIVDRSGNLRMINISPEYSKFRIRMGWMPSHMSIYLRRECFEKFGYYRNDLGGSGDYELFLRHFYFNDMKVKLLKEYIILFTLGGRSTRSFRVKLASQKVHRRCWALNGRRAPLLMTPLKMCRKFPQIFRGLLDRSVAK